MRLLKLKFTAPPVLHVEIMPLLNNFHNFQPSLRKEKELSAEGKDQGQQIRVNASKLSA